MRYIFGQTEQAVPEYTIRNSFWEAANEHLCGRAWG